MKRLTGAFASALCALLLFHAGAAENGRFRPEDADLALPASAVLIGAGAFEGCPAASVYLRDRVVQIGRRAFAECGNLMKIRIPESVVSIDGEAFYNCPPGMTVYGKKGSAAENFAEKAHFAFVDEGGSNTTPDIPIF